MSDGKTHTATNVICLGTLALAGHAYGLEMGWFLAGGALGTFFITPDLDLSGRVNTTAHKNWGLLAGMWYPLRLAVKHRGITHTFLRGPLLLLTYLIAITSVFGGFLYWLATQLKWEIPSVVTLTAYLPAATQLFFLLLGYILAYWIHLWMDGYSVRDSTRW